MPFNCGSPVLPRPGEQLSSHTHTCKPHLGAHRRSDRHQTWSGALQQQLPFPPGSTENWAMEDTWDMAWQQVTVGHTNSVASKGVSTGIKQKCFKHSLHPEKECVWKNSWGQESECLVINMDFPLFPLQNPKPVCQRAKHKVLFASGPLVHCCLSSPGM